MSLAIVSKNCLLTPDIVTTGCWLFIMAELFEIVRSFHTVFDVEQIKRQLGFDHRESICLLLGVSCKCLVVSGPSQSITPLSEWTSGTMDRHSCEGRTPENSVPSRLDAHLREQDEKKPCASR